MTKISGLERMKIKDLQTIYPFLSGYFEQNKLELTGFEEKTLLDYFQAIPELEKEEMAMDEVKLIEDLHDFADQMLEFLGIEDNSVGEITILPGVNKSREKETFEKLVIKKSEIVSIVGPTGSGKSRLLADIEWAADGDTPTLRRILIDGKPKEKSSRFSTANKLVAQLSQNMNFVMDLTVKEFLTLHAESRMISNVEEIIEEIMVAANDLAGEKFSLETPITGLSGGQSRALMIADTAILSTSPIVLIDEIENAGIDRKKALTLLVSSDKIVLMATHDPSLALMADHRIIIKNGGIKEVITTSHEEKEILKSLEKVDHMLNRMRTELREGRELTKSLLLE